MKITIQTSHPSQCEMRIRMEVKTVMITDDVIDNFCGVLDFSETILDNY